MPIVDINWWLVLVATVVNMVVGAIWYSPSAFGKTWAKLTGRKLEEMSGGGYSYLVTTAGAIIQALILFSFVAYAGAATLWEGAQVGFWLWLGFTAITSMVHSVFAGSSWRLWKIDAGYFLVVLAINGAIIAAYR